jgi:hypothetical protein
MRSLLVGTAVIAVAICGGSVSAAATPLPVSVVNHPNVVVTSVKKVGYWRRLYRHGYAVPYVYYPPAYAPPPAYAYYPPAYGYYPPPPAYEHYPPAYGEHVPPPADNGYSEPPPEEGYSEPPPEESYEGPPPESGS